MLNCQLVASIVDLQDLLHVCERKLVGPFCELIKQLIRECDILVRFELLLPILGILPPLTLAWVWESAVWSELHS
jgi:hypothetical protein